MIKQYCATRWQRYYGQSKAQCSKELTKLRFAHLISGHKSATFSVKITSSLYMTSFRAGYELAAMTTYECHAREQKCLRPVICHVTQTMPFTGPFENLFCGRAQLNR